MTLSTFTITMKFLIVIWSIICHILTGPLANSKFFLVKWTHNTEVCFVGKLPSAKFELSLLQNIPRNKLVYLLITLLILVHRHTSNLWVSVCYLMPGNHYSITSWWEQVTFHEMLMMSAFYYTNLLIFFLVLSQCNNSQFRHIILILRQPVFARSPQYWSSKY